MHLHYRNVNDAFKGMCEGFHTRTFKDDPLLGARGNATRVTRTAHDPTHYFCADCPPISRAKSRYGEVLVIDEPVTITYHKPLERVLFNRYRDCNPFFHFIEALWTLAGRDDIKPLLHFNSKVGDFSDNGTTWYGAYGKRWNPSLTSADGVPSTNVGRMENQLQQAVDILKVDRTCRRVVLQQWFPTDLKRVRDVPTCKDVPCNTEVMFLPRQVLMAEMSHSGQEVPVTVDRVRQIDGSIVGTTLHEFLDMTVINRSNDMLWGALGSNYVTFSFLHEYIALASGFKVGKYNQISNNLHVYIHKEQSGPNLESMKPTGQMLWSGKWSPAALISEPLRVFGSRESGPLLYPVGWDGILLTPLSLTAFNDDLQELFSDDIFITDPWIAKKWNTPFFGEVVQPILMSWANYKMKKFEAAISFTRDILAADWSLACSEWLDRRYNRHLSA